MFDVGTRQTIAADNPVARCTGPATLEGQRAHATPKNQFDPYHGGCAATKPMIFVTYDLDAGAGPVRIRRQGRENAVKPVDRGTSQQVVAAAQIQIAAHVRAT